MTSASAPHGRCSRSSKAAAIVRLISARSLSVRPINTSSSCRRQCPQSLLCCVRDRGRAHIGGSLKTRARRRCGVHDSPISMGRALASPARVLRRRAAALAWPPCGPSTRRRRAGRRRAARCVTAMAPSSSGRAVTCNLSKCSDAVCPGRRLNSSVRWGSGRRALPQTCSERRDNACTFALMAGSSSRPREPGGRGSSNLRPLWR